MSALDVWVVVSEDLHDPVGMPNGIEIDICVTEEDAIAAAKHEAENNIQGGHDAVDWDAELTPAMKAEGWVLRLPYGTQGSRVSVLKRKWGG